MSSFINRKEHHQQLNLLRTNPGLLADIHMDTVIPEIIASWFEELKALKGVPFNYLIPGEQFLPPDSIRFFQLDSHWINALVAGAFSIGSSTAGDRAHDEATYHKLQHMTTEEVVSGFFLRSGIVKGSPDLGVVAYDTSGEKMTDIVRFDHISPTIILFVVKGATPLDHVDIHQQPEGLHFGINADNTKSLRYVTIPEGAPPDKQVGDQIDNSTSDPISFRSGSKRVLPISHLASNIDRELKKADANKGSFTSAEFALEMIEGVQAVRFCVEDSSTCDK